MTRKVMRHTHKNQTVGHTNNCNGYLQFVGMRRRWHGSWAFKVTPPLYAEQFDNHMPTPAEPWKKTRPQRVSMALIRPRLRSAIHRITAQWVSPPFTQIVKPH